MKKSLLGTAIIAGILSGGCSKKANQPVNKEISEWWQVEVTPYGNNTDGI